MYSTVRGINFYFNFLIFFYKVKCKITGKLWIPKHIYVDIAEGQVFLCLLFTVIVP